MGTMTVASGVVETVLYWEYIDSTLENLRAGNLIVGIVSARMTWNTQNMVWRMYMAAAPYHHHFLGDAPTRAEAKQMLLDAVTEELKKRN